jgi:hypothetical protein
VSTPIGVAINPGTPVVSAQAVNGVEGQTVTLSPWFAHPDDAGPYDVAVSWGDGQVTDLTIDSNLPQTWDSPQQVEPAEIRTAVLSAADDLVLPPAGGPDA